CISLPLICGEERCIFSFITFLHNLTSLFSFCWLRTIRVGEPTAVVKDGICLITVEPAPITDQLPTSTPGIIVEDDPMWTPSPTDTSPVNVAFGDIWE